MLFNLYRSGPIPQFYFADKPGIGFKETRDIIGPHSEIPSEHYNYEFNSDGLRSVEFSAKPNIVALGCSLTLGQGLPENLRWTDLLQDKLKKHGNFSIGNISYSGAAISKDISSFFGMINKYEYLPEIVICNFANFERFYFVDGYGSSLQDWYINYSPKKTKVTAPWNYEEILPYEWVYYHNLDHIKMLEVFCKMTGIKLIWSCWSNALKPEQEDFLINNFKNYIQDPVRKEFPEDFEFSVNAESPDKLTKHYKMHNWDNILCHKDLQEQYPNIFDYGYDFHKIAGKWGNGSHWPHPGVHKQMHWADFYYNELLKRNWI